MKEMKTHHLLIITIILACHTAHPGDEIISIWPEDAPGIKTDIPEKTKSPDDRYFYIFNPTLQVVAPEQPNGTAVVICPGGGYAIVCAGKEGRDVAARFAEDAITCFILKYRLPTTKDAYFKHPVPLADVQLAIKYVRYHAEKWNVDPDRIGVMGFSAGGHLASMAMTWFDKPVYSQGDVASVSCRPDFAVLVYPVINSFTKGVAHGCTSQLVPADQIKRVSSELNVSAARPPTFLVHAREDQMVLPKNSMLMYDALKAEGVSAELKLYNEGHHGFGIGKPGTDSVNQAVAEEARSTTLVTASCFKVEMK